MFTGIIQDIGVVTALDKAGDWVLTIAAAKLPLERLPLGASVACNGICLTVIRKTTADFTVQLSNETVQLTTAQHWQIGQPLNLETALRVGDELGGHIVSGHVDGVAELVAREFEQDSLRLTFALPEKFAAFVAPKGSITLDGVSLTVNQVSGGRFGINIIPYTQQETTLGKLQVGHKVNFEIDMIARYVARMLGGVSHAA